MPATAADVERRWSDHGFIHSKNRNRLGNDKVRKLTTTRATLVAAAASKRAATQTPRPLSVPQIEEYFDSYLNTAFGGRGEGDGEGSEREQSSESEEESDDEGENTD